MLSTNNLQKTFITIFTLYLLIGMHIVLPTPGGYGLYLAPNIIGWIFIALLISFGLLLAVKYKQFIVYKDMGFILIALSLLLLPILFDSRYSSIAIPRMLALLGGCLLFFSLYQCQFTNKQRKMLLAILYVGIYIEVFIGVIQFYILNAFDIQVLGYTPIYGRPYGSFTQPNVMSSFINTGFALSLYFIAKDYCRTTLSKASVLFFIFSSTVLIVLLQSKTGYLTFCMVLPFFVPSAIRSFGKFKTSTLLIVVGIAVGMFSQLYVAKNVIKENIASDQGVRTTIYSVGARMVINSPLKGHGYGSFEKTYREFHIKLMQKDKSLEPPLVDLEHPHNEVLLWVIEGGLIAFIGVLVFVAFIFRLIKKQKGWHNRFFFIAILLPLLLHSQLEYPFSHSIVHFVMLIVLLWFFSYSKVEKTISEEGSSEFNSFKAWNITNTLSVRVFAWSLSLVIIPFMLTTMHTAYLMEQYKRSGNQNTDYITAIVNPLAWQHYYEMVIYTQGLMNGYKNRNPQALHRYIDWGAEFVKHTPRAVIYNNMLAAIITLTKTGGWSDTELENSLKADFERLYGQFG